MADAESFAVDKRSEEGDDDEDDRTLPKDQTNPQVDANPADVPSTACEEEDATGLWTVVNHSRVYRKAGRVTEKEQETETDLKQDNDCNRTQISQDCNRTQISQDDALQPETVKIRSQIPVEPSAGSCSLHDFGSENPVGSFCGDDEVWSDGGDGVLSTITDSSSGHQSSNCCSSERARIEQAKLMQRNALTYPGPRGSGSGKFNKAPGIPAFEAIRDTNSSAARGRQPPLQAHGTPAQTDYLWLGDSESGRTRTASDFSFEEAMGQMRTSDFPEHNMTAQQRQLEAERNLLLNSFTDPGPKGPKSGKNGRMWLMSRQLSAMKKAPTEASQPSRINIDNDNLSTAGSSVPPYERGWLRTPSPEYREWLSRSTTSPSHGCPPGPASVAFYGARPMAGPVGPFSEPQFVEGYPPYPQPHSATATTGTGPGFFPGVSPRSQARPGLEPYPSTVARVPLIFDNNETQEVEGLLAVLEAARLPQTARAAIESEVKDLGAIDVRELTRSDWEGLRCWKMLKVMEQRRVLSQIC